MKKKDGILLGAIALIAIVIIVIVAVIAMPKKGDAGEETTAGTVTETQGTNDGESESQDESGETEPAETVEEPDFSSGLTENGYFEGYDALDYVTLMDYEGIKVPADKVTVSDEDFEKYLANSVMANYTETKKVTDREVKEGDTVNIDYVGMLDGEAFENGSAEGYNLEIGSGKFIPGFENQIIGHKSGEEFDINVTFPDPYTNNPDMSGKETVFHITLNSITETVVPELDDEFVKENIEEFDTAEAYRQHLREEYDKGTLKQYVWNQVIENSEISEIPQALVDNYVEQQVKMFKSMAASYGTSYEELLSYYGMTEEEFKESEAEYAQSDLTSMLMAQAVCEKEGITIQDGDDTTYFGYDADGMQEIYDFYGKGYVNQILLLEKAAEFISDKAVIE